MGLDGREALCWEREGECEHERSERLECLMHEGDGTCQNRCRGLRVRYMASCTHAQPSLPSKKPVCACKMLRARCARCAAPPCSLIAQTTICRIAAPFARISSQRCSFTISKRKAGKNHPPPAKIHTESAFYRTSGLGGVDPILRTREEGMGSSEKGGGVHPAISKVSMRPPKVAFYLFRRFRLAGADRHAPQNPGASNRARGMKKAARNAAFRNAYARGVGS